MQYTVGEKYVLDFCVPGIEPEIVTLWGFSDGICNVPVKKADESVITVDLKRLSEIPLWVKQFVADCEKNGAEKAVENYVIAAEGR